MVSVAQKLSTIEEWRQDQSCLFQRGDYKNKDRNPEKLSWVRFPVKMVSVARKLSMIKERRQDQSSLFRRGDYRNKGYSPEKLSWVRFPVEVVSVVWKLSTIEEWCQDQTCLFQKEITEAKTTTMKIVLGSTPDEDGFCSSETKHDRKTMPTEN
jgi:hypothetical protein